ncbi:MAG: class I SAM-dependent RNA methyltransferase [Pyrinomonadaceae bacterium]
MSHDTKRDRRESEFTASAARPESDTQLESETEPAIEIERILPGGYGLAHHSGKTLLIGFAAPGDILRVKLEKSKARAHFASIQEIITTSPERVSPRCQHFGVCGGCDFQHLDYSAQIKAKSEIVRDCLRRIAGIPEEELNQRGISIRFFPAPNPFEYRTRARWQHDTENGSVGYFKRGSNEVCDVHECPILAPHVQREFSELRIKISREDNSASRREIRSYKSGIFGDSPDESVVTIAGEQYYFNDQCFFQSSTDLLPAMIEEVIGAGPGQTALDLYCGVGLFTLPLARQYKFVAGVEGNQTACAYARFNATNAELNNIQIDAQDVEKWLSSRTSKNAAKNTAKKFRSPDLVVLDPPRTGAGNDVTEWLVNSGARQIVYVSCDPATLARDLKALLKTKVYDIDSIAIFDLFPQTHHVETVVRLSHKEC